MREWQREELSVKCPECGNYKYYDYPFAIGYDPQLRKFICPKCKYVFYQMKKPKKEITEKPKLMF